MHLLQESSVLHADAVERADHPIFQRMTDCLPAEEYGAVCRWLVTMLQPDRRRRVTAETALDSLQQLCSVPGSTIDS